MASIIKTENQSSEKTSSQPSSSRIFRATRSYSLNKISHPNLKIEDTGPTSIIKDPRIQENLLPSIVTGGNGGNSARQKQNLPTMNPCLAKNLNSAALIGKSRFNDVFALKQSALYTKIENEIKNLPKSEYDNSMIISKTPFQPISGNRLESISRVKAQQKEQNGPLRLRQKSVEVKSKRTSQVLLAKNQGEENQLQQILNQHILKNMKQSVMIKPIEDFRHMRSGLTQKSIVSTRSQYTGNSSVKKDQEKSLFPLSRQGSYARISTEEGVIKHRRILSEPDEEEIESLRNIRESKVASLTRLPLEISKGYPAFIINHKPQVLKSLGAVNGKVLVLTKGNYSERSKEYRREMMLSKKLFTEAEDSRLSSFHKVGSRENL